MSQSVLERLVVELTTDTTGLESGLRDAEQQVEQSTGRIETSAGSIAAATGRAVLAIGAVAAAAGGALVAAAGRAAAYADEIDKLAIRTRIGTDTLQELRFAADQAGVPFTAIEANIRAFTGRLAEVERGGGSAVATFERLGVALRDDAGGLRDTESLFLDTVTALAGVENETERAALAVQAFGEQGSALLPFLQLGPDGLNDLRERARDLGLVLNEADIARLVEYQDKLSEVQQQFGAIVRDITIDLLPVLEDLIPIIQDSIVPAVRDFAEALGADPFKGLRDLAADFNTVRDAVAGLSSAFADGLPDAEGFLSALSRLNPFTRGQRESADAIYDELFAPDAGGRRVDVDAEGQSAPVAGPNIAADFLTVVRDNLARIDTGILQGTDLVRAQIALIDQARERARQEFADELLEQVLEDLFQIREDLSASLGDLSPAERLSLLQASLGAAGIGVGQTVSAGFSTDAPGAAGLVPFEDAADAVTDGAEAAAGVTTRAALQFATTVAGAGASLADALRSGSPRAVGSSLASGVGSIVGLFNPAAGSAISVIGGLLSGFLPSGQATEASRAAGAAARGAPAVEFNLTQNNSIAVNGMPEFRDALTDSVTQLARVIETNLIPRITRLEANA
jgi:hypothetical protein